MLPHFTAKSAGSKQETAPESWGKNFLLFPDTRMDFFPVPVYNTSYPKSGSGPPEAENLRKGERIWFKI